MKYDPILEEIFFEMLFEYYGRVPEDLPRKCAVKAHDFYSEDEMGVEIDA